MVRWWLKFSWIFLPPFFACVLLNLIFFALSNPVHWRYDEVLAFLRRKSGFECELTKIEALFWDQFCGNHNHSPMTLIHFYYSCPENITPPKPPTFKSTPLYQMSNTSYNKFCSQNFPKWSLALVFISNKHLLGESLERNFFKSNGFR